MLRREFMCPKCKTILHVYSDAVTKVKCACGGCAYPVRRGKPAVPKGRKKG